MRTTIKKKATTRTQEKEDDSSNDDDDDADDAPETEVLDNDVNANKQAETILGVD